MSDVGKTNPCDQPDIPGANNANTHEKILSARNKKLGTAQSLNLNP
jgi:hypothetical protein